MITFTYSSQEIKCNTISTLINPLQQTQQFRNRHEDEAPSVEWIPSGCCNQRGFCRPPTACRRRSEAVDQNTLLVLDLLFGIVDGVGRIFT
jgi:hypothetical protein